MDSQQALPTLALAVGTSLDFNRMAKHFLRALRGLDKVIACGLAPANPNAATGLAAVYVGDPRDTATLHEFLVGRDEQSDEQEPTELQSSNDLILGFPLVNGSGWLGVLINPNGRQALIEIMDRVLLNLSVAVDACSGQQQISQETTKDKRHFEILKQEHTRSHQYLQSIASAVMRTDAKGNTREVNPAAEKLLGLAAREGLQRHIGNVLQIVSQQGDVRERLETLVRTLEKGEAWQSTTSLKLTNASGKTFCVQLASHPIESDTGCIGHIITLNDVTQTELVEMRAHWQASHDPITQLLNRPSFEAKLHDLSTNETESGQTHALIHIDLDQFKIINDTCGHTAGDHLLQQVAMLIRKELRDSDIEARLGGDEFGVVLHRCGPTKAKKIADNIRHTIARYRYTWQDKVFNPTASVGLTCFDPQETSPEEAMKQADLACYAAKDNGRNNVYVFRQVAGDFTSERVEEMEWVSRINQAIEKDKFTLYCQSIYPLKGEEPVHIEILVRMLDDNKIIPPGAFLPAAERFGRIQAIDRWVVKRTIAMIAENLTNLDKQYRFNINLSGPTLCDELSQNVIVDLLTQHQSVAQLLYFEITETSAIANLNSCIEFIDRCKRLGAHFVLDDFGTGLSSFVYLKQLPVCQIKIDGTFVRDICFDAVDDAMVTAMQQIAEALNIKTVAEFVENQETLEAVRDIGVDYAQGYGLELPLPFDLKLGEITSLPRYASA